MKTFATLCLGILMFGLTGCASFNKEWNAAQAAPRKGIEGPWQGEWRSDKNGHHGALRAVVTQTSPTTYRAHYHAKFMKIFRYTSKVTLTGEPAGADGTVRLAGSAKLSWIAGGLYNYEATVSPTNFTSTYKCKWDHGKYQMSRP